jgi:hypothetical protein
MIKRTPNLALINRHLLTHTVAKQRTPNQYVSRRIGTRGTGSEGRVAVEVDINYSLISNYSS